MGSTPSPGLKLQLILLVSAVDWVFGMAALLAVFATLGCGTGAPSISRFNAGKSTITAGSSTTLTGVFDNGIGTVDHGVGAVISGNPKSTGALFANTIFTLTVTNTAGMTAMASATVAVVTLAATGSMVTARSGHTATLLPNGKVLVAGGVGLASSELYDPGSGSFSPTGSMATARSRHTATLLRNGNVLVAGGVGLAGALASAELYDAASGSFSPIGSMTTARSGHAATLLPNDKVLFTGGGTYPYVLASAELYDAASGSFSPTGSMTTARSGHTATLLPNDKVLFAGGGTYPNYVASAELYDYRSGSFSATGSMLIARQFHTATLLPNGKVLVAGGGYCSSGENDLNMAELYDPALGAFGATDRMTTGRLDHTATLLPNGKVFIAGGLLGYDDCCGCGSLASVEVYDPVTGAFDDAGSMSTERSQHAAALLLPSGKVLVAGGDNRTGAVSSAEVYSQ